MFCLWHWSVRTRANSLLVCLDDRWLKDWFIDLLDSPLAGNGQGIFKDGVQSSNSLFIKCNAAFLGTISYLIASVYYEHLFTGNPWTNKWFMDSRQDLICSKQTRICTLGIFSSAKNGVQMECEWIYILRLISMNEDDTSSQSCVFLTSSIGRRFERRVAVLFLQGARGQSVHHFILPVLPPLSYCMQFPSASAAKPVPNLKHSQIHTTHATAFFLNL